MDSLKELAERLKGSFEQIGQVLHEVDEKSLYKQGGFSSVNEWVLKEIGYTSAWCTQHLQAYRLQRKIEPTGAKLKNLSAARVLHELNDDTGLQLKIAQKAFDLAAIDNRESISSDDIQKAVFEIIPIPEDVTLFCERFGIANIAKIQKLIKWYQRGKGRDESKWESMKESGVLSLEDENGIATIEIASCHVSAMGNFEKRWADNARRVAMDTDPRRIQLNGSINQMIEDLERYRGLSGRIYLIINQE